MSPDTVLAVSLFAFVSSITPGPNNLMLLASGMNFGIRATIPHMLGVNLGFIFLLGCIGMGLGALFTEFPTLATALKWLGSAYLFFLAFNIAFSGALHNGNNSKRRRPMNFWEAVLFQWVNPKAWAMSISVFGIYLPADSGNWTILLIILIFGVINMPSICFWMTLGSQLKRLLTSEISARIFNVCTGLLLVSSLIPMWF